MSVLPYVSIEGGAGYVVTFETKPRQLDEYGPTFEEIVATFRPASHGWGSLLSS